jgi:hypothetical protein
MMVRVKTPPGYFSPAYTVANGSNSNHFKPWPCALWRGSYGEFALSNIVQYERKPVNFEQFFGPSVKGD